jgi:hypothetical protein
MSINDFKLHSKKKELQLFLFFIFLFSRLRLTQKWKLNFKTFVTTATIIIIIKNLIAVKLNFIATHCALFLI